MSDVSSPDIPPRPKDPEALYIVLFGRSSAGKTSLLAALGEAAHTQQPLLHGQLTPVSEHLDALRSNLHVDGPPRNADVVDPYPVTFEALPDGRRRPRQVSAVFLDCDGAAANGLLDQDQESEGPAEQIVERELDAADTLILAIDASSSPQDVESDFTELDLFLDRLEQQRGSRADVGGWPVYLVLTKCDLLAQPGDTIADWIERIEERKREVHDRFREFIEREPHEALGAFGRIDMHVWATAIKRPGFTVGSRPGEPYGVAELFRQCLAEAVAFRNRRGRAQRRLSWTVGGALAVVTTLLAFVVGEAVDNWNSTVTALERELLSLRAGERSEGDWLRSPADDVGRHLTALKRIREDPEFPALTRGEQDWVQENIATIDLYLNYLKNLQASPRPWEKDSIQALEALRTALSSDLSLPRPEWEDTEAGGARRDLLLDTDAMIHGVDRLRREYLEAGNKADQLWTFRDFGPGADGSDIDFQQWSGNVEDLLVPLGPLQVRADEVIDGSATGLTYSRAEHFLDVERARDYWESNREPLVRLLNVLCALGLATGKDRPAVLVLPRELTLEQVRQRREELQRAYPGFEKELVLDKLPDAVQVKVRQKARTNYVPLLKPGRAEVLRHLQEAGSGTEETPVRWQAVRAWLDKPKELTDWRALAGVLLRLSEPRPPDPVQALQSFLGQPAFTLKFQRVLVDIPDNLDVKPDLDARFAIYHPPTAGANPAIALVASGEGKHIGRGWQYTFALPERQQFTFRPGDRLWGSLPLRGDQTLTWTTFRSTLYRLDCLRLPPRLHGSGEAAERGNLEDRVRLTFEPDDGVPKIPDLLPVVRLESR